MGQLPGSNAGILRGEQKWNREQNRNDIWRLPMVRIARESLALVSVVSFVWMMCSVAQLVA
ncbi:cell division inhibitor SidA [Caulobacter sp. B11]|uniref:cell division inhibitor SidA n=1 Tax=Caulobacter sp. B11 TaxID=2048899 RepID=UPI0035175B11